MALGARSRFGLDWLNFFVANIQAGFGPFVAVYLAGQKWTQVEIGLVLSIGTIAAMISQVPAGALVDWLRDKRLATAAGLVGIMVAALLTALTPAQMAIAAAQVLHGFASSVISPSIAAISLAVVGLHGMGRRVGRNARFASLGNAVAAALMGLCAGLVSERAVFVLAACFTLPAFLALRMIPAAELHPEMPPPPPSVPESPGLLAAADRRQLALVVFAAAAFLFQLCNAAQLPLASIAVTATAGRLSGPLIAACVVVPQAVVALLSPRVGEAAESFGRKWILVAGFAALPLRALLFALAPNAWLVVLVQVLDGVSATVYGIMVPLIAADLSRGTGRYNLVQGLIGLTGGLGATFSTSLAGLVADAAGTPVAFLGLAVVGAAAVALLVLAMPETRADAEAPGAPTERFPRPGKGSILRRSCRNHRGPP